jgi:hypothetical protein
VENEEVRRFLRQLPPTVSPEFRSFAEKWAPSVPDARFSQARRSISRAYAIQRSLTTQGFSNGDLDQAVQLACEHVDAQTSAKQLEGVIKQLL